MRDLSDQISDYIDHVSPAVTIDEVARPLGREVGGAVTTMSRYRKLRVLIATAACLVLVGAAATAVRAQSNDDRVSTGPAATVDGGADTQWLTPFGREKPTPSVPEGWKVLDFADMRFAVPEAWATPVSRSCSPETVGVVLVASAPLETACSPMHPLPVSTLVIEPATTPAGQGTPVIIGTFAGELVDASECPECPSVYRLDNGYQITLSGPDAERVRSTFTDSGTRRALQSGPELDTSDWQTVTHDGVSFDAPPTWNSVDLPGSYTQTTGTGGAVVQQGGKSNPGDCGNAVFSDQPAVFFGSSPLHPSCPFGIEKGLKPRDGAWIRALTDDMKPLSARPITQGRLNGLDITIVDTDRVSGRAPSSVLDMEVNDGDKTLWMTLGVSTDASIARSVLRSIRPAGQSRSVASATTTLSLPVAVPWTAPNDRTNSGCPDELRAEDPTPYATIAASDPNVPELLRKRKALGHSAVDPAALGCHTPWASCET